MVRTNEKSSTFKKYAFSALMGLLCIAHGIFFREIRGYLMTIPKFEVHDCIWTKGSVYEIIMVEGGVYVMISTHKDHTELGAIPFEVVEKAPSYKVGCGLFK